jgi:putative monooxygenase
MKPIKVTVEDVPIITERGGKIQVLISPKNTEIKQFILGVSTLEVAGEVHNHIHDFSHEAFYVIQGEGIISFLEHDDIQFSPGDAVHVPKGIAHKIKNTGTVEMKVIFTASPLAPTPEQGHREI